MVENRSAQDEERVYQLEAQLKEAQLLAEEADRKYDEVSVFSLTKQPSLSIVPEKSLRRGYPPLVKGLESSLTEGWRGEELD